MIKQQEKRSLQITFFSWMFWIETAAYGCVRIVKCGLDGSSRQIIIENIKRPSYMAICLDLTLRRIISVDDITSTIFWMNYDGATMSQITFVKFNFSVLKKVTFYDDTLYLHDSYKIYRYHVNDDHQFSILKNYTSDVCAFTYFNVLRYIYALFFCLSVVTGKLYYIYKCIPLVCATRLCEPLHKHYWKLFPFLFTITSNKHHVS